MDAGRSSASWHVKSCFVLASSMRKSMHSGSMTQYSLPSPQSRTTSFGAQFSCSDAYPSMLYVEHGSVGSGVPGASVVTTPSQTFTSDEHCTFMTIDKKTMNFQKIYSNIEIWKSIFSIPCELLWYTFPPCPPKKSEVKEYNFSSCHQHFLDYNRMYVKIHWTD